MSVGSKIIIFFVYFGVRNLTAGSSFQQGLWANMLESHGICVSSSSSRFVGENNV